MRYTDKNCSISPEVQIAVGKKLGEVPCILHHRINNIQKTQIEIYKLIKQRFGEKLAQQVDDKIDDRYHKIIDQVSLIDLGIIYSVEPME